MGAGVANVKLFTAGGIGTVVGPVIEAGHDVMGMVVADLADAVYQAQCHAAVIGPISSRLVVETATNHPGDGIFTQIFSCSAFGGHTQRIRHAQAIDSRFNS